MRRRLNCGARRNGFSLRVACRIGSSSMRTMPPQTQDTTELGNVMHIDVISDVICPWCYVGKRRLEKAIAAHSRPVTVRWLAFQLNPQMPQEGISRREYRTRKFGSWERS